jgi:hypothetical protein
MAYIYLDGKKYKVIETLPYQQAGMKAKIIETPAGEKAVVMRNGIWRLWTSEDRLGLASRYTGQTGNK